MTCVIVEDQTMFLDLLAAIMALRGGIRIVAQARDVARRYLEVNPRGRVLADRSHTAFPPGRAPKI